MNKLIVFSTKNNILSKKLEFNLPNILPQIKGKIVSQEMISMNEINGLIWVLMRLVKEGESEGKLIQKCFFISKILNLKNIKENIPISSIFLREKDKKFKDCKIKTRVLIRKTITSSDKKKEIYSAIIGIFISDERPECQTSKFLLQKIIKNKSFYYLKISAAKLPMESLGHSVHDMMELRNLLPSLGKISRIGWYVMTTDVENYYSKICWIEEQQMRIELNINCLQIEMLKKYFNSGKGKIIMKIEGDFVFVIIQFPSKKMMSVKVYQKYYLVKANQAQRKSAKIKEFGDMEYDEVKLSRNLDLYSLNFFKSNRLVGMLLYNSKKEIFYSKRLSPPSLSMGRFPLGDNFAEVSNSNIVLYPNGELFLFIDSREIANSITYHFNLTSKDSNSKYSLDMIQNFDLKIEKNWEKSKISIPENFIPSQSGFVNLFNKLTIDEQFANFWNLTVGFKNDYKLKFKDATLEKKNFLYFTHDIRQLKKIKTETKLLISGKYLLNFRENKGFIEKYLYFSESMRTMIFKKISNFNTKNFDFKYEKIKKYFIGENYFFVIADYKEEEEIHFFIGVGVNNILKRAKIKNEFEDYYIRKISEDELIFQFLEISQGNVKQIQFGLMDISTELLESRLGNAETFNATSLGSKYFQPIRFLKRENEKKEISLISKNTELTGISAYKILTLNFFIKEILSVEKNFNLINIQTIVCNFGDRLVIYDSRENYYYVLISEKIKSSLNTILTLGIHKGRYIDYKAKCFKGESLLVLTKITENGKKILIEIFNTTKLLKGDKRILNSVNYSLRRKAEEIEVGKINDEYLMLMVKYSDNIEIMKLTRRKNLLFKPGLKNTFTAELEIFQNGIFLKRQKVKFEPIPTFRSIDQITQVCENKTFLRNKKMVYSLNELVKLKGFFHKIQFEKTSNQFKNTSIEFQRLKMTNITPKIYDFPITKLDHFSVFQGVIIGISVIGIETTLLASYSYEKNILIGDKHETIKMKCKKVKILKKKIDNSGFIFVLNCEKGHSSSVMRIYYLNENTNKFQLIKEYETYLITEFYLLISKLTYNYHFFIDISFEKFRKRALYRVRLPYSGQNLDGAEIVDYRLKMNLIPCKYFFP